jgi:pimeloyl-ACP methyl ester carboxylesterase
MDAAGVGKATICGTSLGGMIAMALAPKAPERVEALVLACTSPSAGPRGLGPATGADPRRGSRRDRRHGAGSLLLRRLPRPASRGGRDRARRDGRPKSRRLLRLRRGDPRHGPAGTVACRHHRPDPGAHRRQGRRVPVRGPRRADRRRHSRRSPHAGRGRPSAQPGSAGRLRRRRARLPHAEVLHGRAILDAKDVCSRPDWSTAARCWATPGSIDRWPAHRLHRRLPGDDHPLRLERDLGSPRPGPSHPPPAGAGDLRQLWLAGRSFACTCAPAWNRAASLATSSRKC